MVVSMNAYIPYKCGHISRVHFYEIFTGYHGANLRLRQMFKLNRICAACYINKGL